VARYDVVNPTGRPHGRGSISIVEAASGRPVLAQSSGFAQHVPVGEGLLAFASVDDAVAGVEQIVSNYAAHAAAARDLAVSHFAAETVLRRLLDRVFDGRHD